MDAPQARTAPVGRMVVILPVTAQGAGGWGIGVLQDAVVRGDVGGVEIDQAGVGRRPVRIVAGRAGGQVGLHMAGMAGKARAAQDNGRAVAFIAQGKIRLAIRGIIRQDKLAFEQGGVG